MRKNKARPDPRYYKMRKTEREMNRKGFWSGFHAVFRAECKAKLRHDKVSGWTQWSKEIHEAHFDCLPV